MSNSSSKSEIRDSIISELLEKVRKVNYEQYLVSIRLEKIRRFQGAQITFSFPVTALIGPNGSGKSTILNAAACIYSYTPGKYFQKSRVGDNSMDNWEIEFEILNRNLNSRGTLRSTLIYRNDEWSKSASIERKFKLFGINRTVPITENNLFTLRKKLQASYKKELAVSTRYIENIDHIKSEVEKILGKSMAEFQLVEFSITTIKERTKKRFNMVDGERIVTSERIQKSNISQQILFIGNDAEYQYSEFNFGAGESSVIRIVSEIENLPDQSLVLIEEIENGLHPLAVRRLTEYLIEVAKRKRIQIIFTTHSDYAISPLPPEAVWACIDGRLQQGKLSVEVLRAVSGRIDRRLAIFVEDEFAKVWVRVCCKRKIW